MPDSVGYDQNANRRADHFNGYSINSDGRYVSFSVRTYDTFALKQHSQVFVHDRINETTKMISVNASGESGTYESVTPEMSDDRRFVVFSSTSKNLFDNSGYGSVLIHDQVTGSLELISAAPTGTPPNGFSYSGTISGDGRFVVFGSKATNLNNMVWPTIPVLPVFVHDRKTKTIRLLNDTVRTVGGYLPRELKISGDGKVVVFSSRANDLVNVDNNYSAQDIFLTDNPLSDSNSDLITLEVRFNGKAREIQADAAQLLTGSLYEVTYKVTNNSPDRLS